MGLVLAHNSYKQLAASQTEFSALTASHSMRMSQKPSVLLLSKFTQDYGVLLFTHVIMVSTFLPVSEVAHMIKITKKASLQTNKDL